MMRILVHEFLSGGGLADTDPLLEDELMPSGRAMRDAMVADLLALPDVQVTATDCRAAPLQPAPGQHRLSVLRAAPGEAPLAFMLRAAQGHDGVWVVAPETDQMLLKCCQLVAPARWLGCDAHSIRQASSKQRTLAALREAGVLTPLDFVHENDVSRWVVKPDDGAGAVDTHVHASLALARQEAQRRRARGETVVLEPWVDGEALSLSLMCRAGQAEVLSVNTQHLHVRDGGQVVFDGVTRLTPSPPSPEAHADPRTAPFAQLARRVAGALPGLHGFVGVDLVWHPRLGAVLVEVNPRITCAYVGLSAHLGRNLAADVLANREALHAPA